MRLSSLSLTFLSTPGGLSGRPGPGRRSFVAPSSTAAAPGLLPRSLGPGEGGRGDGSESTREVSNRTTASRLGRSEIKASFVALRRLAVARPLSNFYCFVLAEGHENVSVDYVDRAPHHRQLMPQICTGLEVLESKGCEGGSGE